MAKITITYNGEEIEWDVRGRADGDFEWELSDEDMRKLAKKLPLGEINKIKLWKLEDDGMKEMEEEMDDISITKVKGKPSDIEMTAPDYDPTVRVEECQHCGKNPVKPKTVYDLDEGDECYLLHNNGNVIEITWYENDWCKKMREQGRIRTTKEPQERQSELERAVESIRKYKRENGLMFEPDWEDEMQWKWYIRRNHYSGDDFVVDDINHQIDTQIGYFKTREDARQVISECESELRVIFNLE